MFSKAVGRVNFEFDEFRTTCRMFGIGGLRIDGMISVIMSDKVGRLSPGILLLRSELSISTFQSCEIPIQQPNFAHRP